MLNAFADREFESYWFETGTPTFLLEKIKKLCFEVSKFTDGTLYATKDMLKDYRDDNPELVPLLYQTGYLTLGEYHKSEGSYSLVFPNEEVKFGFLKGLLPLYVGNASSGFGKDTLTLNKYVENGETDGIRKVFEALAQIEENDYAAPFAADQRILFKIGVNFDSTSRQLTEWKVVK